MGLGIKNNKTVQNEEIRQLIVDKAEIPIRLFMAANLGKDFPVHETNIELTDDAEITVTHITVGKRIKKAIFVAYPSDKQVLRGGVSQMTADGKTWLFQISTAWVEFFNAHATQVLKDVETSNNNNNV